MVARTYPVGADGEGADDRGASCVPADRETATGITLLGVLLSTGITLGLGMGGPWWLRVATGLTTTVLLVVLLKASTPSGRGPVARIARWAVTSDRS